MKKKKEKPFFLKFQYNSFHNGEILWTGGTGKVKILDIAPKNTRWQKFKRWLGMEVFNPEGYIKVIKYEDTSNKEI